MILEVSALPYFTVKRTSLAPEFAFNVRLCEVKKRLARLHNVDLLYRCVSNWLNCLCKAETW